MGGGREVSGLGGRSLLVGGSRRELNSRQAYWRGTRGGDFFERGLRENLEQYALAFFPHAEHPAGWLQQARTRTIDAYVERDRPLNRLDHVLERDLIGRTG